LTLRELVWMAEARQRDAWGRTSTLLAMIANVARAMGGKTSSSVNKTFKPADFDPFEQRKQAMAEPLPGNIRMLKDVFVKPTPPQKGV
jgi:hypothetical protein